MLEANLIMGLCFGVFHVLYGLIVMQLSRRGASVAAEGDD
jgi:hypothetical protein